MLKDEKSALYTDRYDFFIAKNDVVTLIRKRQPKMPETAACVLMVPGFTQNRFTWDIPGRSLAEWLAGRGHDIFILEHRGRGFSRRGFLYKYNFEDLVERDLARAIEKVAKLAGKKPFVMGHSLGGVMLYALPAEAASGVAGIITIGAPTHFGKGNPGFKLLALAGRPLLSRWLFKHLPLPPVPAKLIGLAWVPLLPVTENLPVRLPMELWRPGSMEFSLLARRITSGFDRESFGILADIVAWTAGSHFKGVSGRNYRENMKSMTVPILAIAGNRDMMCLPEAVKDGVMSMASADKTVRVFTCHDGGVEWGHIDLITGRKAPYHVWPAIAEWIEKRAGACAA